MMLTTGVVSPGRAVVAASQYTAALNYREDTFGDRFSTELGRSRRKIGVRSPERALTMTSLDSVVRWRACNWQPSIVTNRWRVGNREPFVPTGGTGHRAGCVRPSGSP
ncbi:hypothetical protein [Micromonospora echinaurantiaca]|uniref:hypothetical protein n=1 Tax=Micromonospora echinaurantiaca TaxID=47857 RepID=UPI003796032A